MGLPRLPRLLRSLVWESYQQKIKTQEKQHAWQKGEGVGDVELQVPVG